jgi:hypothetical protein
MLSRENRANDWRFPGGELNLRKTSKNGVLLSLRAC